MDKTCCTLKKGKISADTGKTDACIAELSTESDCKKKIGDGDSVRWCTPCGHFFKRVTACVSVQT